MACIILQTAIQYLCTISRDKRRSAVLPILWHAVCEHWQPCTHQGREGVCRNVARHYEPSGQPNRKIPLVQWARPVASNAGLTCQCPWGTAAIMHSTAEIEWVMERKLNFSSVSSVSWAANFAFVLYSRDPGTDHARIELLVATIELDVVLMRFYS